MDCSLPESSVHGILQARTLAWVAVPFSRGSSRPWDRTWVSCTEGRFFTIWTTREALLRPRNFGSHILLYQLPWWLSGKQSICQCRRPNPRVGKIPWRRKWQPILVFLPGEFHGQRSLMGYSPQGCKESDMTEWLHTHTHNINSLHFLNSEFHDFSILVYLKVRENGIHSVWSILSGAIEIIWGQVVNYGWNL